MAQEERLVGSAVEKLDLLKSPLSFEVRNQAATGTKAIPANTSDDGTYPQKEQILLAHNDDATNLEVFYDLFLACINLFSQNQQLSELGGLSAYAGFFCIIWTTWFLTGMYDVRFLKDSIFERFARSIHLGVLVGFVVVSPNFKPDDQDPVVFKTFSLILMVSRLCLALEYGVVLFHLRAFKTATLPVAILIGKNVAAAVVYFAISFIFREGHSSRAFSVWYVVAGVEIIASLTLSYCYKFLSFQGTYIMKRMGLLTCIFFGEGVAVACGNITKVVKVQEHDEVWTSATIGVVTACICVSYIVFMVYFDWVSKVQLPGWRQLTWTLLHFPLHLAMCLFMEGSSQFIVFWKVSEIRKAMLNGFLTVMNEIDENHPEEFPDRVLDYIDEYITKFPPVHSLTNNTLQEARQDLRNVDFASPNATLEMVLTPVVNALVAMENTLWNRYGIDFTQDVVDSGSKNPEFDTIREQLFPSLDGLDDAQGSIAVKSATRFRIVYQYTFACAGIFLAFANLISIVSRTKRWTWSASIYHAVIFVLALCIGLVAAVSQDAEAFENYSDSPWILPTLLLTFFLILILNHVSGWLAARRDAKTTQRHGQVEQYSLEHSNSSGGVNKQQYTPVSLAVPDNEQMARNFSVPRRPLPYEPYGSSYSSGYPA